MRGWHELVAVVGDLVPGGVPVLAMALVLLAATAALLWYWFPEWVRGLVRGVRRFGRVLASLRRGRRRGQPTAEPAELPAATADDELPEQPAAALAHSADELAAAGRFKEAVRERLRAIVRDLVERRVIEHHPGWTVTELAQMAGWAHPATADPLAAASETFSRIWYGQWPATAADDAAMREYGARVRAVLDTAQVLA